MDQSSKLDFNKNNDINQHFEQIKHRKEDLQESEIRALGRAATPRETRILNYFKYCISFTLYDREKGYLKKGKEEIINRNISFVEEEWRSQKETQSKTKEISSFLKPSGIIPDNKILNEQHKEETDRICKIISIIEMADQIGGLDEQDRQQISSDKTMELNNFIKLKKEIDKQKVPAPEVKELMKIYLGGNSLIDAFKEAQWINNFISALSVYKKVDPNLKSSFDAFVKDQKDPDSELLIKNMLTPDVGKPILQSLLLDIGNKSPKAAYQLSQELLESTDLGQFIQHAMGENIPLSLERVKKMVGEIEQQKSEGQEQYHLMMDWLKDWKPKTDDEFDQMALSFSKAMVEKLEPVAAELKGDWLDQSKVAPLVEEIMKSKDPIAALALLNPLAEIKKNYDSLERQDTFEAIVDEYLKNSKIRSVEELLSHLTRGLQALGEKTNLRPADTIRNQRGETFTLLYKKYTEKGILDRDVQVNMPLFTANSSIEEQNHYFAIFFTKDLNNYIKNDGEKLIDEYDVLDMINADNQSIEELIIFAKLTKMHIGDKWATPPSAKEVKAFFVSLYRPCLAGIKKPTEKQYEAMDKLWKCYRENSQNQNQLDTFLLRLSQSSTFIEAISAEGQIEALSKLMNYFIDFVSEDKYRPEEISEGICAMIDQTGDLSKITDGLPMTRGVSHFFPSDVEKELWRQTFKALISKSAPLGVKDLFNTIADKFEGTDLIPENRWRLDYALSVVNIAQQLSMGRMQKDQILKKLSDLGLFCDLKHLNEELAQKQIKTAKENCMQEFDVHAMKELVAEYPFRVVTKWVPAFIESLLPEKERSEARVLSTLFEELEVKLNQEYFFDNVKNVLKTSAFVEPVLKSFYREGGRGLTEIFQGVSKHIDPSIDSPKESNPDLNLLIGILFNQLETSIIKFVSDIKKAQELRLKYKEDYRNQKLTSTQSFLLQTLPQYSTSANALLIKSSQSLINLGFKGLLLFGEWGEEKAKSLLMAMVDSQIAAQGSPLLRSLRPLIEKNAIPVIKVAALAVPALIKKHDVMHYFEFMQKINDLIQSDEQIDEDKLKNEILIEAKKLLGELSDYAEAIDSMLKIPLTA